MGTTATTTKKAGKPQRAWRVDAGEDLEVDVRWISYQLQELTEYVRYLAVFDIGNKVTHKDPKALEKDGLTDHTEPPPPPEWPPQ